MSTSIETSNSERIRAIIKSSRPNAKERKIMASLFAGDNAEFYADMLADLEGDGLIVIGTSIKDCYEMALQRESHFVGDKAETYMKEVLAMAGIEYKVVSEAEFEALVAT